MLLLSQDALYLFVFLVNSSASNPVPNYKEIKSREHYWQVVVAIVWSSQCQWVKEATVAVLTAGISALIAYAREVSVFSSERVLQVCSLEEHSIIG